MTTDLNKIFNLLQCPQCSNNLSYDESKQSMTCPAHGNWHIEDNMISFFESHPFDKHWEEHFYEKIPEMKRKVAEKFIAPVFDKIAKKNNLKILDAGCGDGVHAEMAQKSISEHNVYVGLDISVAAIKTARKRVAKSNFFFVHSDILYLPFKKEVFDIIFSYGVISYTQNPYKSFTELCKVLKKGGTIGLWLYPKNKSIGGILFSLIRKICKLIGSKRTNFIANLIVPFLSVLPTHSKLSLKNATWKQCKEVIMVNIAPENLYFPTKNEIINWFSEQNIAVFYDDTKTPITLWGIKQ